MANIALTPQSWSYWTGMAHDLRPDTSFLTKLLIGDTRLGGSKVTSSPIEDIKYDFYLKPQEAAPLRGFHDESVHIDVIGTRTQRVATIPAMPMQMDVDIREVYDSVPPPMEDLRASVARLNEITKGKVREKMEDAKNLVSRRIEQWLGQIIATQGISYNDGTYSFSHDFELESSFKFTAGKLWSAVDSTPIEDLRSWRNQFAKFNGKRPSIMICGENVADLVAYNDKFIEKLEHYRVDFGNFEPEFKDSELVEHLFRLRAIGDFWSYFGQYDNGGTRTNYLDKDRIYFVNADAFKLYYGSIYSTLFGSNPVQQRDVFTYVEEKPNHKGYHMYYETKPFPVVTHPYAIMSVKVL